MRDLRLMRYAAFAQTSAGGNPAGVWIDDVLPPPERMQAIAAEVGYSETAFVAPESGLERQVRYYSPQAEVSFCGHATVATGVAMGAGDEPVVYRLATAVGKVPVEVHSNDGHLEATLTSVEPRYEPAPPAQVDAVLDCLGWDRDELDESIPPARAYAGAWHLVLSAASRNRLDRLDYEFDRLKTIMLDDGLTTVQLIWREAPTFFHSRNPFPVGGVVEDPATGAAAAAFGGYLREAGLVEAPARLTIRQGEVMGRPGVIGVEIPERGGIRVTGRAVPILL